MTLFSWPVLKRNMCMKEFIFISMVLFMNCLVYGQRVGIGNTVPVAKLDITGLAASPSIPGATSTGIVRIGVSTLEGVDIGKMGASPFSGWIQSGYSGNTADPLSLQPSGGNVGIGTSNPVSSAALDVSSTSKGFLPPRMTLANRNSISSPAEGLMIWCNDCGIYGQIQVFNGITWTNMVGGRALSTPAIGDNDGGGIVAYILQVGDPGYVAGEVHGLIAAPSDQLTDADWGCSGINLPGANNADIGGGNQNTLDITTNCLVFGIAAQVCISLALNGYTDWYLPSKSELNKLYLNRAVIGGFDDFFYWSSNEGDPTYAWSQLFLDGTQTISLKTDISHVRAIRSF